MYENDSRIVATLDAGGTNFVFGAMQAGRFIGERVSLPAMAQDLDACIGQMKKGFHAVIDSLGQKISAISFAFPGPADYARGIIGGYLPNFPSFRDGVALGRILEKEFGVPVFINNDGDLFAYGEALCGVLPWINGILEEAGNPKRYKTLLGYTFGTGFGFGAVWDGRLHIGDNSAGDTYNLRNIFNPGQIVEENVSARAVVREYLSHSGKDASLFDTLTPKDIFDIAEGTQEGDRQAAVQSFADFGRAAGDAMATAVSLFDGIIAIGGGITAASKYYMPALMAELDGELSVASGEKIPRLQLKAYDLDNPSSRKDFVEGGLRKLQVYGSDEYVIYDPQKKTGVATSRLGASNAVSIGAYVYALANI